MTATRQPRDSRHPRRRLKLRYWPEFIWLWLSNENFRAAPNKRRVFLDQRAVKKSQRRFS